MMTRRIWLTGLAASAASAQTPALEPRVPAWFAGARTESLQGATGWLNAQPLQLDQLKGKVVLIDFWTYTCINWRREFAYVRTWADKYKRHGLVVIGVHSPEFSFEREIENVRLAVLQIGVSYPVAVDSNHEIWDSFRNAYWPALYFIDAQGRIRHHQFGEGSYDDSERVIQRLLSEAGMQGVPTDLVSVSDSGPEAPPALADLRSAENYFGYGRSNGFASPGGIAPGIDKAYALPQRQRLNTWALAGEWRIGSQSIASTSPNGRLVYMFHARDLYLVMAPRLKGQPTRFRIRVDGKTPEGAEGVDVDAKGMGTLNEPRMYQLIRQRKPIGDRQFEIEFLDSGVDVFNISFG